MYSYYKNTKNIIYSYAYYCNYFLLEETLKSAEDLHGKLIAALRNNEFELGNSLILSINMNKEIETTNFDKSLERFKIKKTDLFNSINKLP